MAPGVWYEMTIDPQEWSDDYTFFSSASDREIIWYMQKQNASDDSDPDLYVNIDGPPTHQTYLDLDTSTGDLHQIRINNVQSPSQVRKWYARVHAFGTHRANVRLMYQSYACPGKNCGSAEDHGTCDTLTGTCTCAPEWQLHEDCSATLTPLERADFSRVLTGNVPAGTATYYKLTIPPDRVPIEVAFHVSRAVANGAAVIRLRKNSIPTAKARDLETSMFFSTSDSLSLVEPLLSPGDWYLQLEAPPKQDLNYELVIKYNECPNGCSGHGQCNATTHKCHCNEGWDIFEDCSVQHEELAMDQILRQTIRGFETAYLAIDIPKQVAESSADLVVQVTVTDPSATTLPMVFIQYEGPPSSNSYLVTQSVPRARNMTLRVPRSMLREGNYYVAVNNVAGRDLPVSLRYGVDAYCPKGCTKHGTCTKLGECRCASGWYGADCSVSAAMFKENTSGVSVTVFAIMSGVFLALGLVGGYWYRARKARREAAERYAVANPNALHYVNLS